jgi:hypothetical protein
MQKQEFETIINEQLALFNNLKEEFINQKDFEMAVSLRGIEKYLIDIQKIIENKREIPQIELSPNFFKSNYSVGRFHTSMIAYIVELWNSEESYLANIIFENYFEKDCFEKGKKYYPKFEYDNIDLVIFEDENYQNPVLFIEMKVHDYEYWSESKKSHQLEIYSNKINEKFGENKFKKFFFTLGTSQYSGVPSCKKWELFTLDSLIKKLSQYEGKDKIINQWRCSLRKEYDFKNTVFKNGYLPNDSDKNKAHLYKLGQFSELLSGKFKKLSCFSWGNEPDIIMNFGYRDEGIYMEITDNMCLNLKVNIEQFKAFFKIETNTLNFLYEAFERTAFTKIINDDLIKRNSSKKTATFYRHIIFKLERENLLDNFLKLNFTEEMLREVEAINDDIEKLLLTIKNTEQKI